MAKKKNGASSEKQVTRYAYDEVKEPRTPETGHTSLMPSGLLNSLNKEQILDLLAYLLAEGDEKHAAFQH